MSTHSLPLSGGNGHPYFDYTVAIRSREMLLPATPSPPHPFFLSCLDLLWQTLHYNRKLLFYSNPSALDASGPSHEPPAAGPLMQKLKNSLSLCLVHYYCWCGRIAKGIHPPYRLFIDCNDAGVEFVEASIDLPLSSLAEDGFQMKPLFDELCQKPDHKGDSLFSSPLLSIQATLFSDGGLAVGIAQSHVVADGQSLWDFMVSWGECSRGLPLSLPPVHDRQILAVPDSVSPEELTWSFDVKLSEEDGSEVGDEVELRTETGALSVDDGKSIRTTGVDDSKSSSKTNGDEGVVSKPEKNTKSSVDDGKKSDTSLVQWMFTLSASAVKKLKAEAGEGHTSFDVMCAHFWKRISVARKAPSKENTYLFAPVNCRKRWSPPLPPAYFGNVIGFCICLSKASIIRREPFGATASRVHSKVATITQEHVQGFMQWLEAHECK